MKYDVGTTKKNSEEGEPISPQLMKLSNKTYITKRPLSRCKM